MRNLKKILALALALVMTLSLVTVANAFTDSDQITADYTEAVEALTDLGVFEGYEDGSFQPKGDITRAEVAAIIYRIATGDVTDSQVEQYKDYNKFEDVPSTGRFAGYINYCASVGYIKGTSATTFAPDANVTGYEVLAMILRFAGYDQANEWIGSGWEAKVASTANQLGVTGTAANVTLGKAVTREVVAELLFRAMQAPAAAKLHVKLATSETPVSQDFACVISKSGEVSWKIGVTDFDKLAENLADSSEYQRIEVLPNNGEEYPYLYPDSDWQIYVMDSKIADWLTEDHVAKITSAFEEWKSEVYSILDLDALFGFGDPYSIDVSEDTVTDEIQAYLDDWDDVVNKWMACNIRNSVPTTTSLAVGKAVADDAWNYIYNLIWTQTGEDLAGHAQVDIIAALIGSAFVGIDTWEGYTGVKTTYPFQSGAELLKAGYLYTNTSGLLYSAKEVKELDNNYDPDAYETVESLGVVSPSVTGSAFACIVDKDLNVYWKFGIDYCSGLLELYGFDSDEVVQINLAPEKALLYNGYSYFTVPEDLLNVTVLGEAPSWYEEKAEEIEPLAKAAFAEWQTALNEAVDFEGLSNMLSNMPTDAHTEWTPELFDALKEWVGLWNETGIAGYINIEITTESSVAVGPVVWNNMFGMMSTNYKKMNHAGCPGPTTEPVLVAYALENYGKVIDAATNDYMGNVMNDSFSANVASYIAGLETDETGYYKYQSAVTLWESGCIPFFDGEYWYVASGPDGDVQVIFSATNEELLDSNFTFNS